MSEDSEDDREGDEDVAGDKAVHKRKSNDETIIRSGYLWKKGERRKVRDDLRSPRSMRLRRSLTRCYRGYIYPGLEEAVVRVEICSPGILQDFGRIPATPALGPRRYSHLHTCHSQEARQHLLHRLTQADVLPPSGLSEGSAGMGQSR